MEAHSVHQCAGDLYEGKIRPVAPMFLEPPVLAMHDGGSLSCKKW